MERFTSGNWAVDFELSRVLDYSRYANVRHVWRFSRRLRMSDAIGISKKTADIFGRVPSDKRRISRHGLLTTFSSVENSVSEISMPSDRDLFGHALTRDLVYSPAKRDLPVVSSPFYRIRRSDQGDYVHGLLNFAGGLDAAIGFLLHEFWVSQLDRWGASSKVSPEATKKVRERLAKTLGTTERPIEEQLDEIANTAVRYARSYRSPWQTIKFKTLSDEWTEYRSEFWKRARKRGELVGDEPKEEKSDRERHERDALKNAILDLVSEEVLFQGVTLSCRSCRHKNWISISKFDSDLACEVCQEGISIPLELDWEFKLNDFILQSIRDQGVHAVVWALKICRDRSNSSFFFLEPTEVWMGDEDKKRPYSDIDITAVIDGHSYIIEVKSSASNFGEKHRRDFVNLIARVQPERAVLAIMENLTDSKKERILGELQKCSGGVETQLELWTLDQYPFEEHPYL
tara:strand:- start:1221 stop:2597 length:1377 start_codon:yes stop_codon:yes gene_type:complete